jgi:formylglycine-generating enzyme required for sulfatase activity
MTTSIKPSAFESLSTESTPPPEKSGAVRWVVLVIAALFLAIMAFLFSAKSLQINIEAESDAKITLRGGLLIPFGGRYLLLPGEFQVQATAAGYHVLRSTVTVTEQPSQVVEFVLQPLPGLLSISSQPNGAKVLIDSELVGVTPLLDYPVVAGEHSLEIQASRYQSQQQLLTVIGRQVLQQLNLILEPAWADISIDSDPSGAAIVIAGEERGTTPAVIEILQGEHQVSVSKAGFSPWQIALEVTSGVPQQLAIVKLQPAAGVMELSSVPSGANVTLDGEFQGQTPLILDVSPGRAQRLSIFKAGYKRYSTSVTMVAAQSSSRAITLIPQLGEVKFNISPVNATLKVGGQTRGNGSRTLSLPALSQPIEVSLEGYATVRQRVTPRQGLQQVVNITLQTAREAQLSRIKPEVTSSLGQTLLLFSPAENGWGDFTMGASRRDPGRRANEVLHPVSLTRMFYVQTTEVSNAQFRFFLSSHNSGQIEGKSLNREHQPVVQVSWQQAAQFCNWLSTREELPLFYRENNGIITGYNRSATGYRLPTEAEWAWVARLNGAAVKKFPWGDTFPPSSGVENYADTSSAYITGRILNGYTDGSAVTATVASFPPSGKGLYDIGGNVAEWVHDVYTIPPVNGAVDLDPTGGQSGDNYVVRGASWTQSKISELRLSYRDYGQAGRDDVGFRIARYAE